MICKYNLTILSEKYQSKLRQDFEKELNSCNSNARFSVSSDLELASSDCHIENNCGKQLYIKSRVYCYDREKIAESK